MTPSQLNELAAVRVMGFTKTDNPNGIDYGTTYYSDGYAYWVEPNGELMRQPFRPATDIADAWRLVEKMESMDKGSIVYGHYYTELSESSFYTLTAPMAARTITLAALRAVGVREEEMK